ncbi:aspartate aminotransferase family protein [Frigoribacterium sp. CFBP 8751]|uniref:aspartate aminotransferase family protein n=1 Tax=Frigoribacterium sp. CFBP 8751 TaxID=2775277 RepID=UPI00177F90E9|nr:aminotransferase class III-fold pyridoxal phosphate-dependent enzyme [Frigoribacterium sp. CFBP 8751]MBD8539235.1 aminotransferase class III-fold pyridoxal phosphate-dependent enzyme [Frigoribacterium sp. CFBP 8751]
MLTLESATQTFTERFAASARATEHGKGLIPGGYSRTSFNFGPHAVFVTGGNGAFIDTVDGHRLMDFNNNFTVNILGHGHEAISDALIAAIPSGASFGNPVSEEAELAAILIDRIASVEKVQFSCSASESVMTAARIARAYTGRTKIAKFEGGYHGFTDPVSVSVHTHEAPEYGTDGNPRPVADDSGVPQQTVDLVVVLTQNDLVGTERILREHGADLACVFVELESGAGGHVMLSDEFVHMLRRVTNELGIVLVIDETANLRAAYHGLQSVYGVEGDLTVMGKIIGGGLPLGAVGGRADIMSVLETGRVAISGTHHGHRLALVAGIACMRALDMAAYDRLNSMAGRILADLSSWAAERNSPFTIFGRGFSSLAYAYCNEPGQQVTTHRDYWHKVDAEGTQALSLELANRGFFPVARGELSLSLAMTDDDISAFIQTVKDIVTDLES